jgi:hypothetical protein
MRFQIIFACYAPPMINHLAYRSRYSWGNHDLGGNSLGFSSSSGSSLSRVFVFRKTETKICEEFITKAKKSPQFLLELRLNEAGKIFSDLWALITHKVHPPNEANRY